MKTLLTLPLLFGLTLGVAACGPDNVTACKERCAEVNALECTADDYLDCESQCPAAWNDQGLDYTEYIDCAFGQYQCDEETGDYVFESTTCPIPT